MGSILDKLFPQSHPHVADSAAVYTLGFNKNQIRSAGPTGSSYGSSVFPLFISHNSHWAAAAGEISLCLPRSCFHSLPLSLFISHGFHSVPLAWGQHKIGRLRIATRLFILLCLGCVHTQLHMKLFLTSLVWTKLGITLHKVTPWQELY